MNALGRGSPGGFGCHQKVRGKFLNGDRRDACPTRVRARLGFVSTASFRPRSRTRMSRRTWTIKGHSIIELTVPSVLPSSGRLPIVSAMHSYELLREVFDKKAPKQVAADLGLSLSMVYKWAEPPNHAAGSGTGNPLDRIEALLKSTGDQRLVQWICQRAGGFFIQNPKNIP